MFFVKMKHNDIETRHDFHSEKYARGVLRATYHEKLWEIENNSERYEIIGKALSANEYRISVKDKGRLYFLDRPADIRNIVYTGILGRKIIAAAAEKE